MNVTRCKSFAPFDTGPLCAVHVHFNSQSMLTFHRQTPSTGCLINSVSVTDVLPAAIPDQVDYSNWFGSSEVG